MIGLEPIDAARLAVAIAVFAGIAIAFTPPAWRGMIHATQAAASPVPSRERPWTRVPPLPPAAIAAIATRSAPHDPPPQAMAYAPRRMRAATPPSSPRRSHLDELAVLARTLPYGEMMRLSEELCREMGAGNPGLTADAVASALHRWATA